MPTDLRHVHFDTGTLLEGVSLDHRGTGAALFADLHWGGADLSSIDWTKVDVIGDEQWARERESESTHLQSRATRLKKWAAAVRAYRQLSVTLRTQGLNEAADRFGYRANVLQRKLLRRQFRLLRYFGSLLLGIITGYGYRPIRSFITYLLVVLGFAAAYLALGGANGKPLSWNEAIVVSMTAFHGRGFFSAVFQPGDLQAAMAAAEAFIGLLIEIVFIATFTNRFFAR